MQRVLSGVPVKLHRHKSDFYGANAMTMQECYAALGGNFAEIKERLDSDTLIARFIAKFLEDGSYGSLCLALRDGQRADAFRAAHSLKGVCASLSFTRLHTSAEKMTECLRSASDTIPADAASLMEEVRRDYACTVTVIQNYLNSETSGTVSTGNP